MCGYFCIGFIDFLLKRLKSSIALFIVNIENLKNLEYPIP